LPLIVATLVSCSKKEVEPLPKQPIPDPSKVYDYTLTGVTIKNVHLNALATSGFTAPNATFPVFSTVNLWVEIKSRKPGESYTMSDNGDINMPVLWKSPVVSFTEGQTLPLNFDIPNVPVKLGNDDLFYYGYNLYALDGTGTYLVGSTWAGAASKASYDEGSNGTKFTMVVTNGITGEMDFHGSVELSK